MMVLLLSCRIVIKMFPYMPNNDLFRYLIESKVDSDEIRIRFFVAIRDMRLNIDLSSKIDIAALSHQTLIFPGHLAFAAFQIPRCFFFIRCFNIYNTVAEEIRKNCCHHIETFPQNV